eukprot:12302425-Alexandrium_andersonii.AAC.1
MHPPQKPSEPPKQPHFAVRFGICANSGAKSTPLELQGSTLRPFLGPRSSSFERPKQVCTVG